MKKKGTGNKILLKYLLNYVKITFMNALEILGNQSVSSQDLLVQSQQ